MPSTLIAMYIYFLDSLKGALGFDKFHINFEIFFIPELTDDTITNFNDISKTNIKCQSLKL